MQRASSRELSSRVDIEVHARPNRVRRRTWWLSFWAAIGSLAWVFWQHSQGENQIYQAGAVTNAHRLIENECHLCHTTWAPLQRLNPFGVSAQEFGEDSHRFGDDLHSIDNKKCEACHRTGEHHANQLPAHNKFSCAACHQEHEGAEWLTSPNDRHCTLCHDKLEDHGDNAKVFAANVTRFDQIDGHPEFKLLTLMKGDANGPAAHEKHGVNRAMELFQRERHSQNAQTGDSAPKWQDRGRIYFNHALHLKPGLPDENRKVGDKSLDCEACHKPDQDHRFFRPINYEEHCRKCHPLLFDHFNFPGQKVPHEAPEVVRGFLTDQYTLRALSGTTGVLQKPEPDAPSRPIPGHRDFQRTLTKEQAATVRDGVARAEKVARDGFTDATELAQVREQRLLGPEASGGCRYCHEIESVKPQQGSPALADWKIVPTNIPSRWFTHGQFHHEPHRLLSCSACHADVEKKSNTGDVMIPSIDICRACHSASPPQWANSLQAKAADAGEKGTESLKELLSKVNRGARRDCIECHNYHDPDKDKWNGPFAP